LLSPRRDPEVRARVTSGLSPSTLRANAGTLAAAGEVQKGRTMKRIQPPSGVGQRPLFVSYMTSGRADAVRARRRGDDPWD
jgi:hypothetical protein